MYRISIYIYDRHQGNVGVSKNSGTPKWMVYNGTPYQKGMIWVYPYFLETPR